MSENQNIRNHYKNYFDQNKPLRNLEEKKIATPLYISIYRFRLNNDFKFLYFILTLLHVSCIRRSKI